MGTEGDIDEHDIRDKDKAVGETMNIHIVLIAYALDIKPLVSLLMGSDTYFHIYTHSQLPVVADLVDWPPAVLDPTCPIFLHDYGVNRGLSTSWNDGIIESQEQGADATIIINDDVSLNRADLLKLASAAVEHPECGIVEIGLFNERMQQYQKSGFACFAINPIAINTVGYFDENYLVIYGEDVDYSRRCHIAGIPFGYAGESDAIHKGSETIATVPALYAQNQITFPRNEDYHRLKHGGGYGHEQYTVPFNDSQLDWKIEAETRHNPYPAYERTDKGVAKL